MSLHYQKFLYHSVSVPKYVFTKKIIQAINETQRVSKLIEDTMAHLLKNNYQNRTIEQLTEAEGADLTRQMSRIVREDRIERNLFQMVQPEKSPVAAKVIQETIEKIRSPGYQRTVLTPKALASRERIELENLEKMEAKGTALSDRLSRRKESLMFRMLKQIF